ncbi:MAG: hypothetical protein UW10_C0024G0036, partial [Candidatus Magasanikbacteria bacterium GW2011_GWA2_43_9]
MPEKKKSAPTATKKDDNKGGEYSANQITVLEG